MAHNVTGGKPPKREIELDFLRGVAILMVLDYHSARSILLAPFTLLGFPKFGWCGVDIFFVLSGFLVGGLLVREWQLRGRIDGKRFLIRRGFKIWPQYYFFLFAILITGHRSIHELWGNLLNIQNYVGGVAHTWSLAVEEHAYLLLLGVFAVAARFKAGMRPLFFGIGASTLVILLWRFLFSAHGGQAFPRTDMRVDGIFYGLMLAILYHHSPHVFMRLQRMRWLWIAIIALTLADFRFIRPGPWWVGPSSWLLADATGVAMLFLIYRHKRDRQRPALYRLIAWIGLYSYGIYLWHVSVIAGIDAIASRLPTRFGIAFQMTAPILLGIAIGVVMTKLVEFPALRLRDRLFPTRIDSPVSV